ncbi:hypothetical protein V6N13_023547 [Hibiscus sabdariffa]
MFLFINLGVFFGRVGESGSGKYDPDSGRVTLDGTDIRKLRITWLRLQMGLVSQEPVLFNKTIRTNITYGKQGNANEEEIIAAIKAANAHTFISSLPQCYKTPLDEATSSLDVESEHVVQEALDAVMVNQTTVIVAHRLRTIKGTDIIAVLKKESSLRRGRGYATVTMRMNKIFKLDSNFSS